jgi:excisionase family DNA binding protein
MDIADDRLMTLKDVADTLSISLRTVMRLVADGELPSVLIGRRRLIRRETLRAWLAGRELKQAA